jgi:hypothetical protein
LPAPTAASALGSHRIADRNLQAHGHRSARYLTDVISKIVSGHRNCRVDELLPWAYPAVHSLRDVD